MIAKIILFYLVVILVTYVTIENRLFELAWSIFPRILLLLLIVAARVLIWMLPSLIHRGKTYSSEWGTTAQRWPTSPYWWCPLKMGYVYLYLSMCMCQRICISKLDFISSSNWLLFNWIQGNYWSLLQFLLVCESFVSCM